MNPRALLAVGALAVPGVGAVLVILLIIVFMGGQAAQQTSGNNPCAGSISGVTAENLTQEQISIARVIYDEALTQGLGDAAAIIGIATAKQESDLGADPTSKTPNEDGDVGVFQQRALVGWYADGATLEENTQILNDPLVAARTFFLGHTVGVDGGLDKGEHIPGLVDIDGWQQMTVTQAAQAVQRSAYPDAYAPHEGLARTLVAQFASTGGPVICNGPVTGDLVCPPSGLSTETDLQPDALRTLRCVKAKWPQIQTIGGKRADPGSDHHTGRAVDVMIPSWESTEGKALGDQIAQWARANATGLGVTYIIWQTRIWSVERAGEGWRDCGGPSATCASQGDPSALHLDHVHISVSGNAGTGGTNPVEPAPGGYSLPVAQGAYRLGSKFGETGPHWRRAHTGQDFVAPSGTGLLAVAAATVEEVRAYNGDPKSMPYGNLVILRAVSGEQFYYAHMSEVRVSAGQSVTAGQDIGAIGSTGNSTGPHLHFEVRQDGSPIDPVPWLTQHGVVP